MSADKLDGMEPNQLPQTVASVQSWSGFAGSISGNATSPVFAGPTTTITTTADQNLVGAAQASLELGSGGPQAFNYGLCYRSSTIGGSPQPFASGVQPSGEATTDRQSWAASSSNKPGAGTWDVGFCVKNDGGSAAFSDNGGVTGWVMVVSEG